MLSNIVAISYKDLSAKGLISDLKQAATCDIKYVCRLPCNRCPQVFSAIDIQAVKMTGLELKYATINKTQPDDGDIELQINADNQISWLKKNKIAYRIIYKK